MKWIYYFPFLVFCSAFTDQGCRSKGLKEPDVKAEKKREASFLTHKLLQNGLKNTATLSAHAKVHLEGNGESIQANANIIWLKDSVLWMNIKKFGIEGARLLINADSVIALNRLDKTYQVRTIDWLQAQYNLPEGFPLIESFLLGNGWMDKQIALQSAVKDGLHQLYGNNGKIWVDYRIEEGSFLLASMTLLEQSENRSVKLTFSDYKKIKGLGYFPYSRKVEAFSPDTGAVTIEIDFSDVETNESQTYRFEIPSHYERIE